MNIFKKISIVFLCFLLLFNSSKIVFASKLNIDHLSGSNVVTDETGVVIELLDYYPFGGVRLDESSTSYINDYKYTGKELDSDTGLYYYGARYYDGDIGRFVSVDPVILAVGTERLEEMTGMELRDYLSNPQLANAYSYTANNPLKYIDPEGEFAIMATVFLVGIVASIGVTTYGAIINNPDLIMAGMAGRQMFEVGASGIIKANPYTGKKKEEPKVKSDTSKKTKQNSKSQQNKLIDNIDKHGSYEKHVQGINNRNGREYGSLFQNKDQWKEYLNNTISNPSESFKGPSKDLYWDNRLGTIIIDNKTGGAPTAFSPKEGKIYYNDKIGDQKVLMQKGGGNK